MDYLGQELPSACREPIGKRCQVYRSPEELFNPATMASFEGKPVTNTHPTANLDINTAAMAKRGHTQNIRRDGDFLLADLFVDDVGLISEVLNDLKREVSCGYDCLWVPYGDKSDGKYEQKEIIGNHVAIVKSGRAGPRVAIQDSKTENQGGKKLMAKSITKAVLAAMGFKQWAMDADPEEIAKAMDEMKEDKEPAKDEEPKEEKKPAKDADESKEEQGKEDARMKALEDKIAALEEKLSAKDKSAKDKKANDAKSIMDSIAKAFDEKKDEAQDEDLEDDEKKEAADEDADGKEENEEMQDDNKKLSGSSADSAVRKFVHDMSPIIMAHPDEFIRLQGAKALRSFVTDNRASNNAYGKIVNQATKNRMSAMDTVNQNQSAQERSIAACKALSASGEHLRGGK
jgi:hypothetical protein